MTALVGRLRVGQVEGTKVMGIINASPESFYKTSIRISESQIGSAAAQMQADGAQIIDVGALSTAPYLETMVSSEKEISRIKKAIRAIKDSCDLPVSVDTPRANVAAEAIRQGADAVNDVTGLKYDQNMARVVAENGVAVITGAHSKRIESSAISATVATLKESLRIADNAGISERQIIVDPSIGFFREKGSNPFFTKVLDVPWYLRDIRVISNIKRITRLAPTCISVSGKSFLGELLEIPEPANRVVASIACEVYAALHGASIIRTHNVKQTVEAMKVVRMLAKNKRL